MRNFLFLVLLLLPLSVSAQIPSEYTTEQINYVVRLVNRLQDRYDFVIPPIERLPTAPTSYSIQASGNWGADWTGANKFDVQIFDRATRPVVVFIFDTAPLFDHEYLINFADNDNGRTYTGEPERKDGNGHGHHVAGIIGAQSSQYNIGIARALVRKGLLKGRAYEVLSDNGGGFFSWTAQALNDANEEAKKLISDGYFVVYNLSLGGTVDHAGTATAIEEARDIGVFVCAASGNTSNEGIQFPGRAEGAKAIGSINQSGRRSSFSTYGDKLYMGAPGSNILSTYKDGRVVELSGTSMASPHQAGLAAIAGSVHPTLNEREIRKLLIDIATDIDPAGYDPETGHGYDFVEKILNYEPGSEPKPDDPEREEKGKRVISITVPNQYGSEYQPAAGVFHDFSISDITISLRTKKYAGEAIEEVQKLLSEYFTRRAFVLLPDADFLDAGYWAGRYFERYAIDNDVKLNIETMSVHDAEGLTGKPETPTIWKLLFKRKAIREVNY